MTASSANPIRLVSSRQRRVTPAEHLTEKSVKAYKATGERQEVKDALVKGLVLIVQPKTGAKSFQYRGRIDGTPKKLPLGSFPATTLSEVRDAARILLARSKRQTPVVTIQAVAVEPVSSGVTVAEAFELYYARGTGKRGRPLRASTMAEKKRLFDKNIRPLIGDKPFQSVSRDDLVTVVGRKMAEGHGTASNRVHSELSVFWNWAVKQGAYDLGLKGDPITASCPIL